MDRVIIYPGAIPLETDLLNAQKNTMISMSKLASAILGVTTQVNGLVCTQSAVPDLNVLVGAGEIYSVQNVDSTAFSSLSADTTHQILKQGILLDAVTLSTPAPATAGQSINYLVQATYQDSDTGATVLPYYNASNPAVAYSGPANAGTPNNTVRKGLCTVTVKAGTAATTGSQTTPSADSGYVGLYVVTVANGQSTILNANISVAAGAPFISETLIQKISQTTADARYALSSTVSSIQGVFKNLQASATGLSATVLVTADEIAVENASNTYQTLRSVSLSISGASSGANGLDTGSLATSTWYSLWVIWNGTTTAGLMSLSATAPTMPSGYTHKARIGWMRTDSSGNKYPLGFKQQGRDVQYLLAAGGNVTSIPQMASGVTSTTWTAVGVTSYVPSTASKINVYAGATSASSGSNGVGVAPNNSYSTAITTPGTMSPLVAYQGATNSTIVSVAGSLLLESTNIYWNGQSANNASSLFCLGWTDNI